MRVALIVCDEPAAPLCARHGDYPKFFARMLQGAAARHPSRPAIELDVYDVYRRLELPDAPSEYSAVLISGSKWSATDAEPWIARLTSFVRENWTGRPGSAPCKLVGICFGHQVIARAFGRTVVGMGVGWELGAVEIKLSAKGRGLFADRERVVIHSVHCEQVDAPPEGFESLGASAHCDIQGMLREDILTLQGHPEVDSAYVHDLAIYRHGQGVIGDETLQRALESIVLPSDDSLVADCILRFIIGSDV